MDVHRTLQEHHNWAIWKAKAAKARCQTLTMTFRVNPQSMRAIQIACDQAVALYESELCWDSEEVGTWYNLQFLLNLLAGSILGALPTPPWGALMREAGLMPTPVISDSRYQRFTARLANAFNNKLQELHQNPSPSAAICRVVKKEHKHGWTMECINWLALGEELVIKTITLDDETLAKRTTQHWASDNGANVGAAVRTSWTYR